MNNPENMATQGTQDEEKKTQHNMCWTPLHANQCFDTNMDY